MANRSRLCLLHRGGGGIRVQHVRDRTRDLEALSGGTSSFLQRVHGDDVDGGRATSTAAELLEQQTAI